MSKQTHAVIDRFEDDDFAVLLCDSDEDVTLDCPQGLLPDGADEGDHLLITIVIDAASRHKALRRITDEDR